MTEKELSAAERLEKGRLALRRAELMEDPAARCPVCADVWLADYRGSGVVEQVHEKDCPMADWNPIKEVER